MSSPKNYPDADITKADIVPDSVVPEETMTRVHLLRVGLEDLSPELNSAADNFEMDMREGVFGKEGEEFRRWAEEFLGELRGFETDLRTHSGGVLNLSSQPEGELREVSVNVQVDLLKNFLARFDNFLKEVEGKIGRGDFGKNRDALENVKNIIESLKGFSKELGTKIESFEKPL